MNIYEGNENYIFVSYARADSDRVMPILEALDREGFRFWYDSAIEAGSEWPYYVEDRVANCCVMIYFVTTNSVESKNCRDEVNYALSENKEILVAYLEDTKLKYGLALRLSTNQAIHKKNNVEDEEFIKSMLRAKILQPCKKEIAGNIIQAKSEVSDRLIETKDNSNTKIYISCRRAGGEQVARLLYNELSNRYSVFWDIENIGIDYLDSQIKKAITECDDFIIVLSPKALDYCADENDWMRMEISTALKAKKNIIPILLPDFKFPKHLPEDINDIKHYNGVPYFWRYWSAVIEKIEKMLSSAKK